MGRRTASQGRPTHCSGHRKCPASCFCFGGCTAYTAYTVSWGGGELRRAKSSYRCGWLQGAAAPCISSAGADEEVVWAGKIAQMQCSAVSA